MIDQEHQIVRLGDLIRISVALIAQIHDLPEHRTLRVRLEAIQVDPDGSKVLVLTTASDD